MCWQKEWPLALASHFSPTLVRSKPIFIANETCLFEGSGRLGGRAYSHGSIPGLHNGTIRIDLGAYRFDYYQMPILFHVFNDVLGLPLRCYDPNGCVPGLGMLSVAQDIDGNNRGYASGPEGLARLFEAAGGRVFYNKRLTNILAAPDGHVALSFNNDSTPLVTASHVFLVRAGVCWLFFAKMQCLSVSSAKGVVPFVSHPVFLRYVIEHAKDRDHGARPQ